MSASPAKREALRQHYAKLKDEDILDLLFDGPETLTPEALDLLQAEARNRGYGEEIEQGLAVQIGRLAPSRQTELVERFRSLPCPRCQSTREPLNAFHIMELDDAVLRPRFETTLVIGCPQCIRAAARSANRRLWTLGWGGLRSGFLRSAMAHSLNRRAVLDCGQPAPTSALLHFVRENRGRVTADLLPAL